MAYPSLGHHKLTIRIRKMFEVIYYKELGIELWSKEFETEAEARACFEKHYDALPAIEEHEDGEGVELLDADGAILASCILEH